MPIEFPCESCDKQLRVPDGSQGRHCQCPACGMLLVIPNPQASAAAGSARPGSAGRGSRSLKIPCPKCKFELICSPSLLGTKGQCRNCKAVFKITQDPTTARQSLSSGLVFSCPQCEQLFEGQPDMNGKKGKCHACGSVFPIVLKQADSPQLTSVETVSPLAGSKLSPPTPSKPAPSKPAPSKPMSSKPMSSKPMSSKPMSSSPSSTNTPRPTQPQPSQPVTRPSADAQPTRGASSSKPTKPQDTGRQSGSAVRILCAACEGLMEVPSTAAGQNTACPYCQQILRIPVEGETLGSHSGSGATSAATRGKAAGGIRSSQAVDPANAADDVWSDLGDLSGAGLAGAPTVNAGGFATSGWSAPRRGPIRGLTFANVFSLLFSSLFPTCLLAPVLFGGTTLLAFGMVWASQWLGRQIIRALVTDAADVTTLKIALALTPTILVFIAMLFVVNAVLCMTCNTALHAVRRKKISAEVLFGTGDCYNGMLALLFGWTGLNLLQSLGVPYLAASLDQSGQPQLAMVVAIGGSILLLLLQLSLQLLFAYVPFALLDGEVMMEAIGTSCTIFFRHLGPILGVLICGWLLFLALGLVTCGMGLLLLCGAPLFLYAAIYHLAEKR